MLYVALLRLRDTSRADSFRLRGTRAHGTELPLSLCYAVCLSCRKDIVLLFSYLSCRKDTELLLPDLYADARYDMLYVRYERDAASVDSFVC